ncbi:hypothetical protein CPAV1605_316 [seawater metagenome]|uniref:Uncharacterized protein n=1 Tax=seawater metagenome TaxID=1561972 RepID=A0A5E8CHA9_9ZZZZ
MNQKLVTLFSVMFPYLLIIDTTTGTLVDLIINNKEDCNNSLTCIITDFKSNYPIFRLFYQALILLLLLIFFNFAIIYQNSNLSNLVPQMYNGIKICFAYVIYELIYYNIIQKFAQHSIIHYITRSLYVIFTVLALLFSLKTIYLSIL